jgi:hypothetical protein
LCRQYCLDQKCLRRQQNQLHLTGRLHHRLQMLLLRPCQKTIYRRHHQKKKENQT